MKLEFSRQNCEKYSCIKFHENPSIGSRVVPCGQTERHDETVDAFRSFANALTSSAFYLYIYLRCKSCSLRDERIQWNFLGHAAAPGCEGLRTCRDLTPSPSSRCAGGLIASRLRLQGVLVVW